MGAWGTNTFDNDTAGDWAFELEETDDLQLVASTLQRALKAEGELSGRDACEALAACEVVARLKGNWGPCDAYTEDVDDWVKAHSGLSPDALVDPALRVIDRVLGPDSELRGLWDDTSENDAWHDAMEDLRSRVAS